jgi:hypothetical protein
VSGFSRKRTYCLLSLCVVMFSPAFAAKEYLEASSEPSAPRFSENKSVACLTSLPEDGESPISAALGRDDSRFGLADLCSRGGDKSRSGCKRNGDADVPGEFSSTRHHERVLEGQWNILRDRCLVQRELGPQFPQCDFVGRAVRTPNKKDKNQ